MEVCILFLVSYQQNIATQNGAFLRFFEELINPPQLY